MRIIEVSDFLDPKLDVYARLTENQLLNRQDPSHGHFIAESPKVIGRALDAGCEPVSFLIERAQLEKEAAGVLEKCPEVPVFTADTEVLKELTGYPMTRGALCCMRRPRCPAVKDLCQAAGRIMILEHVVNPTNVGAIFRSAAALGMDAVLLTDDCCDPLYRRAIRVSMGTVFQIPCTYLKKGETPSTVKQYGFRTVAMALDERAISLEEPVLKSEPKLAVILGTEGDGLVTDTVEGSDYLLKIPMAHGVDSLNVAAASAVAFWELGKVSGKACE